MTTEDRATKLDLQLQAEIINHRGNRMEAALIIHALSNTIADVTLGLRDLSKATNPEQVGKGMADIREALVKSLVWLERSKTFIKIFAEDTKEE